MPVTFQGLNKSMWLVVPILNIADIEYYHHWPDWGLKYPDSFTHMFNDLVLVVG